MNPLSRRGFLRSGLQMLGVASIGAAVAPARATRAPRISTTELSPRGIGSLTLLEGAGCNVVAMSGPEGSLLIDGGLAANSHALLSVAAAATGNRRVNTLINTHWHPPQTGSNEHVGRDGGVIIAHETTRLYLSRAATSVDYDGTYGPLRLSPSLTRVSCPQTAACSQERILPVTATCIRSSSSSSSCI